MTNITFTPTEPYALISYDLDVALVLEYLSQNIPYAFAGDVSDNTELSYNGITWNEFEEGENFRDKPLWMTILSNNFNAHNVLNQLGSQKHSHQMSIDVPVIKSDVTTLSGVVSSMSTSLSSRIDDLESVEGGLASWASGMSSTVGNKQDKETGKGLSKNDLTDALLTKLNGIASGATVNSSDATLLARANHTGSQLSTTISDFAEASHDAIGAILSADFVYNDGANTISRRARSFTNNASHTIQTVAASANGFQLSSTRDSSVSYSVTVTSVVQIGVATNVSGYVVLEIAATNSSTAGDWQEIARTGTGQNISLAIALASTQTTSGTIQGIVPSGYYARLRSVNSNGTPTYAYNSGQEVLL